MENIVESPTKAVILNLLSEAANQLGGVKTGKNEESYFYEFTGRYNGRSPVNMCIHYAGFPIPHVVITNDADTIILDAFNDRENMHRVIAIFENTKYSNRAQGYPKVGYGGGGGMDETRDADEKDDE